MNAIFGLIRFDGENASEQELQAINSGMAHWVADDQALWREGPAGLGCRLRRIHPESCCERLPLQDSSGRFACTAGGRLDNRAELLRALAVDPAEAPQTADTSLMFAAFLKWGESCSDRLLGDWVMAVWDRIERTLFLARDQHGVSGLYYTMNRRRFAFASSIKGLLPLAEGPLRPNLLYTARILVAQPQPGTETAYEDIFRLPPAHQALLKDQHLDVQRYWYPENAPELHFRSDAEYHEAFLSVYEEAVRCRLRSPAHTGISLSGGMDSSSVAALAAPLLVEKGFCLHAFTSVPLYSTEGLFKKSFGDEAPYVEAIRRHVTGLETHLIPCTEISPLQGIQHALDIAAQPMHASSNAFWIMAIDAQAQQLGITTLLSGQHGNATVSWTGGDGDVIECLRQWRPGEAWQELRQSACTGLGWLKTLRRKLLNPLLFAPFAQMKGWAASRGRAEWEAYSAIRPDFARRIRLDQALQQEESSRRFKPYRNTRQARLVDTLQVGSSIVGAIHQEEKAAFGLEASDPTIDRRVVEFCLGVPNWQYWREGRDRLLLRGAFENRLPPEVLNNWKRGVQSADIGWRILEQRAEFEATLNKLAHSPLAQECLDLPRMRRILSGLEQKVDLQAMLDCMTVLTRGVMTGLFLLRFD